MRQGNQSQGAMAGGFGRGVRDRGFGQGGQLGRRGFQGGRANMQNAPAGGEESERQRLAARVGWLEDALMNTLEELEKLDAVTASPGTGDTPTEDQGTKTERLMMRAERLEKLHASTLALIEKLEATASEDQSGSDTVSPENDSVTEATAHTTTPTAEVTSKE